MKKIMKLWILMLFCSAMLTSKAQGWVTLAGGCNSTVYAMDTFNGQLIVAGCFSRVGFGADTIHVNSIAAWNGTSWSALGGGLKGTGAPAFIYALAVYNGELYAAGMQIDSADGHPVKNIAKWNGTSWSAVGNSVNPYSTIRALCVYHNALYAAGYNLNSPGGVDSCGDIAKWDGTSWAGIGSGHALGYGNGIYALQVYNDKMILGGTFTTGHGSGVIAWDGTALTEMGNGLGRSPNNGQALALLQYNGELYVSGNFLIAGNFTTQYFAKWNGTDWDTVTQFNNPTSTTAMVVYNNTIVAGDLNNGIYMQMQQFNGTSWTAFGGGNVYGNYYVLYVYNGHLYLGGSFTNSNLGSNIYNIAEWTGPTTAIAELPRNNQLSVFPNPSAGQIHIKNDGAQTDNIIITNIWGQQVLSQKITGTGATIDISMLPAGVYFANQVKFIKQ